MAKVEIEDELLVELWEAVKSLPQNGQALRAQKAVVDLITTLPDERVNALNLVI